ncbi:TLC domain-containing protein 5-like isoform X2 [Thalassophryne amazonica]|uniref:TLC domain-containing protein 5-like isoform X2 n=1 Tax=Thalassophryne amazonica TaxID=390379 RepID=UPI0014713E00|nr:TLC domain-containing protein 5-like isoform X2 [Thalassophryne amazonica]
MQVRLKNSTPTIPQRLLLLGSENTKLQTFALATCLGYFFFDMGWCVFHRTEGPVMLAHHTASIACILVALLMGKSGCETCSVIFGSEITNPLLQTRWFLRKVGLYESLLGDAVDLLFILLFATVRVGVGTVMFYCELTSPRTTLIMKLGGVFMYGLAWVFMVDIAKFGYKKTKAKYKRWRENHRLRELCKENLDSNKNN